MDDTPSAPSGEQVTSQPAAQSGLTKANIRGKVPEVLIRKHGRRRKPVKMGPDQKHHVNSLMKRGLISSKAASFNGLKK